MYYVILVMYYVIFVMGMRYLHLTDNVNVIVLSIE